MNALLKPPRRCKPSFDSPPPIRRQRIPASPVVATPSTPPYSVSPLEIDSDAPALALDAAAKKACASDFSEGSDTPPATSASNAVPFAVNAGAARVVSGTCDFDATHVAAAAMQVAAAMQLAAGAIRSACDGAAAEIQQLAAQAKQDISACAVANQALLMQMTAVAAKLEPKEAAKEEDEEEEEEKEEEEEEEEGKQQATVGEHKVFRRRAERGRKRGQGKKKKAMAARFAVVGSAMELLK